MWSHRRQTGSSMRPCGIHRERILRACLVALGICGATSVAAQEPVVSRWAEYFGFEAVEVLKLSDRSSNLLSGDFNHDGLTDLVLIDNSHHRLDLLIQRKAPPADGPRTVDVRDVNRLDNPWRFDHQKLPIDQDVVSLTAGDFNHDGRIDLAYFGNPDQLVIRFQSAEGTWNAKQQMRLSDIAAAQWCLSAGDLNHDGRTDLVILGKSDTLLLLQPETGEFGPPQKLLNTSSQLGLVQAADLNADGREDLCYLAGDALNRSLGVRLQNANGQLGPEYLFDLERPRAVSVREVDGQPGQEILTIDSRTGRLKVLRLTLRDQGSSQAPERLVRYGFGQRGTGRERDLAVGDFDGNGLNDVVVTDPEASRILMYRQTADQGLDLGTPFPCLSGANVVRPWLGSGREGLQLVVHSTSEKAVGISQWNEGRLTFPAALPLDVEPLGLELLNIDSDLANEVVFPVKGGTARGSGYQLHSQRYDANRQQWVTAAESPLELSLKGNPEGSLVAELTGDDRPELLLFQGSKPPVVVGVSAMGRLEELPVTGTLGVGTIPMGAVTPCRLDGVTGLLVSQDNFVRLMKLTPQLRWQVADQFNAGEPNAKIVGSLLLDLDQRPGPELVMIDAGVRKLRLLTQENARFVPWKEVDLGQLEFKAAHAVDLNGDQRDDLLLFGADQFAVLYAGGQTPTLEELASYESTLEQTFPTDVLAGDLNGDQHIDLALIETRKHYLEILAYRAPDPIERASYFTVFEEKGFAREEGSGRIEPREGLIADVTGDDRADLVLLAHDRILVYPQDAGGTK